MIVYVSVMKDENLSVLNHTFLVSLWNFSTQAFPWFMKYVTGGYVGEEEAGERLAQVIDDPQCSKSNVYWSWNGGAKTVGRWSEDGKPRGAGGSGGEIFENEQSDAVRNPEVARRVWDASAKAVGMTEKDFPKF